MAYRVTIPGSSGAEPAPSPPVGVSPSSAEVVIPVTPVTEPRPAARLAPRPETPIRNLIAEYRTVLTRLYELAALGPEADPAECRQLLQEQQRLHDDLGPEFARAVDRQHSRVWAAHHQRCPMCGLEGIYHDPETGETIALDIAALVRFTAGDLSPAAPGTPEAGPSGLRDRDGWLIALPGLGPRRVGPFSPCTECTRGTCATYGDRPLCLGCADAWGTS
jgi:hypothetical protein